MFPSSECPGCPFQTLDGCPWAAPGAPQLPSLEGTQVRVLCRSCLTVRPVGSPAAGSSAPSWNGSCPALARRADKGARETPRACRAWNVRKPCQLRFSFWVHTVASSGSKRAFLISRGLSGSRAGFLTSSPWWDQGALLPLQRGLPPPGGRFMTLGRSYVPRSGSTRVVTLPHLPHTAGTAALRNHVSCGSLFGECDKEKIEASRRRGDPATASFPPFSH